MTVDSSPISGSAVDYIYVISMSASTDAASVGLGRPLLALGAAIGTPAALMRPSLQEWEGMRTATVPNPAVTEFGTTDLPGGQVRGPGQRVHKQFGSFIHVTTCSTSSGDAK